MSQPVNERLSWLIAIIDEGKRTLESVLAENAQLRQALAEATQRRAPLPPVSAEVEAQYDTLTTLFVAALQLHAASKPAQVLTTLEELLRNVVGATAFELFVMDAADRLISVGLQSFPRRPMPAAAEPRVREALASRTAAIFPDAPWAVAPLFLGPRPVGALVVQELLPHRRSLTVGDREMMQLLSEQLGGILLRAIKMDKAGIGEALADDTLLEAVKA